MIDQKNCLNTNNVQEVHMITDVFSAYILVGKPPSFGWESFFVPFTQLTVETQIYVQYRQIQSTKYESVLMMLVMNGECSRSIPLLDYRIVSGH